jgi:hypothetical protein
LQGKKNDDNLTKSMMMKSTAALRHCDQTTMMTSNCVARVIVVWFCKSKRMMTSMVPALVLVASVG